MLNNNLTKLAFASVAVLGLGSAVAGGLDNAQPVAASDAAFYVEGNVGYAARHWEDVYQGLDEYSTRNKQGGFTGGVDAGYQLNKNFAFEAGWMYLPTSKVITKGDSPVTIAKVKSWYGYGALKGMLPVCDKLAVFGKFGIAYNHNDDTAPADDGKIAHGRSNYWSTFYAAGVQYNVVQNVLVNAQFAYIPGRQTTRFDSKAYSTPNTYAFTVGVGYKFMV